jgi:hypothetical protein
LLERELAKAREFAAIDYAMDDETRARYLEIDFSAMAT